MRNPIALFLIGAVLFGAYLSVFTVREIDQAIVLQFGNPKDTVREPGLHFKLPWRNVMYMDKRILSLDVPEQEVIASDQKRLVVDSFARFRIIDPLLTYQTSQNERGVSNRLSTMLSSSVRQVLGDNEFQSLLSGARNELMIQIRDDVNQGAKSLGVEIVDVRIRRADLPAANSKAIFQRMQTERQREAREIRAEGNEQAQLITAKAEREKTVILANATRDSEILRGEGDGIAVKLFAQSFGQDEEFFEFYRSMQAYRGAMGKDDTTLVLSPNSQFFKYFDQSLAKGNKR